MSRRKRFFTSASGKPDCTPGMVKGHTSKSAKVTKQSPAPGKALAPGTKVNVKLDV